jgi:tetratricopeptide (TPR) repeat protein
MQERESGNAEKAAFFLPMAISAYQQAGELDADGLYHLSILLTAKGEFAEAQKTAERILSSNPDHLLGLAAAADAAAQAGDSTTARKYYQQFLQKFDAEKAKPLPEYIDHTRILPDYRQTAETFIARR